MKSSRIARMALLVMRIRRRDHRSRKTPTNGPSTVKGSRIVAKAVAIAPAVGARSGEKRMVDARATWKMPSEPWDSSLTAKSRRKPENRNNAARSRKKITHAA